MQKTMVLMDDPGGMPRAWGLSVDAEAARERAAEELARYVVKRRALGESISVEDFTERTERIED